MSESYHATGRGVVLLMLSTLGFALLYYLTPVLKPLDPLLLMAIRVLLGALGLWAFMMLTKRYALIRNTTKHLLERKRRLAVAFLCGGLLASQLWLFAYGPMFNRALQVSLGYFLMPLVLIVIGRYLYGDKLAWWQWLAVGLATAGVLYEIVRTGAFAWETLWVALMYPLYFVLRKAIGIAHLGGMFWELALICPFAAAYFWATAPGSEALADRPELWLLAPAIGLYGSLVLVIWILSTKYLRMSLFGLLSYVEPGLLMLVSLLLGESISVGEIPLYACVLLAVGVVFAGGVYSLKKR